MTKDTIILIISWTVAIITLIKVVPREKIRFAQITFLIAQAISWVFVYLTVFLGLIEYPVREFPLATNASFSLHYVIFPAFAVLFMLYYPFGKGFRRAFTHYLIVSLSLQIFKLILQKTSSLILYIHWNLLYGILTNLIILFLIRHFTTWFQKGLECNEGTDTSYHK